MTEQTFVLIVGGGPVGLTAALDLGRRNVPAILITRNLEPPNYPKCNSAHARTMEHFRRLGIADELRQFGLPADFPREIAYRTRFCGYEFGRSVVPHARMPADSYPGPERPHVVSQRFLEPVLKRHAERQASVSVRFGQRLIDWQFGGEAVVATVEDVQSGTRRTIEAQFMLAADGARSSVRRSLDIDMRGQDGTAERNFMSGTLMAYFIRAPGLLAKAGKHPAIMTWIINQDVRGWFYAQDRDQQWVIHYQTPRGTDWQGLDHAGIVRAMIGAEVDYELQAHGPWTGGLALIAESFSRGPVFIAGDAAHLFTPLGGFGMNTGIGDALNLTWKFAGVHEGWAARSILDSYDKERRPVALRNTQLGIRCAELKSRWIIPTAIEAEGAEADGIRVAFGERCLQDDAVEYETLGLQLGERYEHSPIVCTDAVTAPEDRWDDYVPLDHPGARAPHFRLPNGEPAYDAFGAGFALLDFRSDTQPSTLVAAAQLRGVPLRAVSGSAPAHYRTRLVLVRPDQHIAWHGDADPPDPLAVIDRVRGAP